MKKIHLIFLLQILLIKENLVLVQFMISHLNQLDLLIKVLMIFKIKKILKNFDELNFNIFEENKNKNYEENESKITENNIKNSFFNK